MRWLSFLILLGTAVPGTFGQELSSRTYYDLPPLYEFVWDEPVLYAVAGDLYKSEDGIRWTRLTQGFSFKQLVDCGSFFIALDGQSLPYRSEDCVTWQRLSQFQPIDTLNGNGAYAMMTVSGNSTIYKSTDGNTWEEHPVDPTISFQKMFWHGSLWLGVPSGNAGYYTSQDGVQWQATETRFSGTRIIGQDNQFYVLEDLSLHTSEDGIQWETIALDTYIGGTFVRGPGTPIALSTTHILMYVEGQGWDVLPLEDVIPNLNACAWTPFGYIADLEGTFYHSEDKRSWSIHPWDRVIGKWQGYYFTNQGQFSQDGRTWSNIDVGMQGLAYFSRFEHRDDVLVAFGQLMKDGQRQGQYLFSTQDFITWHATAAESYANGLTVMGDQFLAWGDVNTMTSTDGLTWLESSVRGGNSHYASGNGRCLALEGGNPAVDDQCTFNASTGYQLTNVNALDLAWDGERFLLIGDDISGKGTVLTSEDGYMWVRRSPVQVSSVANIFLGGPWVMVTMSNGSLCASKDGLHYSWFASDQLGWPAFWEDGQIWFRQGDTLFSLPDEALSLVDQPPLRSVVPWVVNNTQFQSTVSFANPDVFLAEATLVAVDRSGREETLMVSIPARGTLTLEASQLFPQLSGYALYLYSDSEQVLPSFLTFNEEPESGGHSPSQTSGILAHAFQEKLLFGYLPGDQIAAFAVAAPENTAGRVVQVEATLIGVEGGALGQKMLTLTGAAPLGQLLTDLFDLEGLPQDFSLILESQDGTKLAGTTFTFNHQKQPSMSQAFSLGF